MNADHSSGERIDLPGDLIYMENYCATVGHKMNHNFSYNCKEWWVDAIIVIICVSFYICQVCSPPAARTHPMCQGRQEDSCW